MRLYKRKKRCTSVEMNLAERRSIIVAEGDDFQAKGSQSKNFGNIQFFCTLKGKKDKEEVWSSWPSSFYCYLRQEMTTDNHQHTGCPGSPAWS